MESMSIEEEYISTLHTRSNARFFSRSKQQLSGVEMEAAAAAEQQDAVVVPAELQRMMHRRTSSEIELAMAGYFDASDEASEICRQLLANIKNAQSNYLSMDSFLATIVSDSVAAAATTAPLAAVRSNPFSDAATRSSFRRIHDRYSSILRAIKRSHGKVARKLEGGEGRPEGLPGVPRRGVRRRGGASVAVAAHLLLFGLLVGPAAMALCPMALKRKVTNTNAAAVARPARRWSTTGSLLRLQEQLDTAAKGTYVLGRDLDTVSHLVARLSDGIERENAMARRCAERVAADNVGAAAAAGGRFFPVQEMANELRRSCSSSRKLAEELEEHVCLCLATIHRARLLVIKEISKQA
ncbi:Os04g0423200 [Oryza sativa Japonica Group]|uniref:Os04g0423200 protein n=1 Tax=Oryza sativa subsp. japonica TaxID=39947 RepID=A0A0P0WAD5_ORYSJ|nr:Os04g0423200 [Oryza sativa Japonica Group]